MKNTFKKSVLATAVAMASSATFADVRVDQIHIGSSADLERIYIDVRNKNPDSNFHILGTGAISSNLIVGDYLKTIVNKYTIFENLELSYNGSKVIGATLEDLAYRMNRTPFGDSGFWMKVENGRVISENQDLGIRNDVTDSVTTIANASSSTKITVEVVSTLTQTQVNTWRLARAITVVEFDGKVAKVYVNSAGVKTYFINGQVVDSEDEVIELVKKKEKADAEKPKAQEKKTRSPNAAVAGAIAINIIAEEFINPELKEMGVSVGATVGGSGDLPETAIGVGKDLGDGWSANVGIGTDSGNLSVGVNKSVDVTENIRVGAGVSYSDAGWSVGPSVQVHNGEGYGVGVTGFGAIPTVTVAGYTVAVVPQLFIPNLIVIGAQMIYKAIKSEVKAEVSEVQ
jgi:hypothetical protein